MLRKDRAIVNNLGGTHDQVVEIIEAHDCKQHSDRFCSDCHTRLSVKYPDCKSLCAACGCYFINIEE
jgi:hypothetical protein